jgi:hypothetical protein
MQDDRDENEAFGLSNVEVKAVLALSAFKISRDFAGRKRLLCSVKLA